MSRWSKASLLASFFSLVVMAGAWVILGTWYPLLYAFLALFIAGLAVSVLLDYKLYLEFLSIKTAKKGLSLGWSLLLAIVMLTAVSYLGSRFDRSFDLTEEGLNSLSEQSLSALKKLDSDIVFYIFYKGDKISDQARAFKQELKSSLSLYRQNSSRVKIRFIDTYKNHLKAEEYLSDLPDKSGELFVFVSYKDRKIRVDIPWTEEALSSGIIQAQKREFKEILFLTGHGERDLHNSEPEGLKILSQSLKDSGFALKEWNFVREGAPKSPPVLIAVLGPRQPFLEAEKEWLKTYLSQGGALLLSLDPKEKHGLQDFLKSYGLIFNDDFILNRLGMFYGGFTKAFGVMFDRASPITKKLSAKQAVFFEKASSLDVEPSAREKFEFSYLVQSHRQSWTVPQLKKKIEPGSLKSFNMALEAQPKKSSLKEEGKPDSKEDSAKGTSFRLALFGDSDFLSNRYIYEGANKDLILNSFVSLAGEEELASIRPKQPKGTKISLNRPERMFLVLSYIIWPCLFLLMGLWLWFKRRSA